MLLGFVVRGCLSREPPGPGLVNVASSGIRRWGRGLRECYLPVQPRRRVVPCFVLDRVPSPPPLQVCNYPFTTRSIKMGHFYLDSQQHQVGRGWW